MMNRMILAALLLLSTSAQAFEGPMKATDGGTLKLTFRLHGIDTPERDQVCRRGGECYRCGKEATAAMRALIGGRDVRCEPKGDRSWDRLVAVCYVGEEDLGKKMLELGWAVTTKHLEDKDPQQIVAYVEAAREGMDQKRGMWAGEFLEPKKWRRGERLEGRE